jgi:hypothetical protein
MTDEALAEIKALEEQLQDEPGSQEAREGLLLAYVGAHLLNDARRIQHVAEFVRLFPRTSMARCPLAHVDALECPEGFALVEQAWLRHRREHPTDPEIARGLALFIAGAQPDRAREILQDARQANPGDAALRVDAANICAEPRERLSLFQEARRLGSSHPNLRVWIARSAIDAGELDAAERMGNELLASIADLRAVHGERLEWTERGKDLWSRARGNSADEDKAHELVAAIRNYSNWTHWAHTALGVVAARRGNVNAACEHLRVSSEIAGDHRLRSYGPSFRLAQELVQRAQWAAVAEYLRHCRVFWDPDELVEWLSQVEQQQLPEFPDQ